MAHEVGLQSTPLETAKIHKGTKKTVLGWELYMGEQQLWSSVQACNNLLGKPHQPWKTKPAFQPLHPFS